MCGFCQFAPITGAWIETQPYCRQTPSSPFAPITGAWIETMSPTIEDGQVLFAPITGAWIETSSLDIAIALANSHPSRVRGLKRKDGKSGNCKECFAPITGAWIETWLGNHILMQCASHPSRVRGLKLFITIWAMLGAFRTHHGCVD